MKHRIALIATLLAALAAAVGIPASAAQAGTAQPQSATTLYTIHNLQYGCVTDPGHGNVVYVRFNCGTTFNLIDEESIDGFNWYLIQFHGGGCLNWDPSNGFVYDDSCIAGDPFEQWEYHSNDQVGNLAASIDSGGPPVIEDLMTCQPNGNARLAVPVNGFPHSGSGCYFTMTAQITWLIEQS